MSAAIEAQTNLLGPIVTQWIARHRAAERSKERFTKIAQLCRQFFGGSAKAMWEEGFRNEFFPSIKQPVFQVNLNKAFELVAVIGPNLYWKNPERKVGSYRAPDQAMVMQALGIQDKDAVEMTQAQQQNESHLKSIRNSLSSLVLDYVQQEQPRDAKLQVEMAINEMMLTGLGLMWTQTYEHPGTGEKLVQNTYGSVDDLLIDPDCRCADWSDAKWISVKHLDPVWVVERKFGYPPGYLHGRGTRVSAEWGVQRQENTTGDKYSDMMEWYETWSVGGVGARVHGVDTTRAQFLDRTIGDHAYLCTTPNVPHPLNVPPQLMTEGSVEQVKEALRWRTYNYGEIFECWRDNRWPVEPLSPYKIEGTPWPLAVMAPGLGYLIAMNLIMVSKLAQSWENRREILGVAAEAYDDVMAAINSDTTPAIVKINPIVAKPIGELIQYLQRPSSPDDLLRWMEYLGSEFAKATGLLDIHYGVTNTQARINADIDSKNRAAAVRPEKMQQDIITWVRKWSTKELWLASMYISGEQLQPLLGPWGAVFWEQHVRTMPLEVLIREMTCFIDAKDLQRPDHARDLDALSQLAPLYLQTAAKYAEMSGDSSPLNGFISRFAGAMDMRDPEDLLFGSWRGQPDPQTAQLQQQTMALQAAKLQADVDETQAKTIGRLTDTQFKMRGVTPQQMQKIQLDELKFQQETQQDIETHLQRLMQNEEMFRLQLKYAALSRKTSAA